ncbi:DUF262 domain-containing protein [Chryseobacterium arthrosphaerae]|uniref:Uncharacterized conserved protein, contains ParB-like and HNH nuclease domains n=1 Tax=Soonwooa buanensis TaxID=619805 RepID=A0A1T5CND6_9FLAO|nr:MULTISPECIES: DUF262 domain-containing protein [Chryseobacterium group]QUY53850.1 DUF262 domain-containing protein [Chryseobacterium arthrosphaerae]SKB60851.1 Uncharacterized conserved protein, contains ParB-like and HNH nuclease domains [Soonwooa buanensis]
MAYEAPITIKKAIENIRKKHYVLPSIQREFVWDSEQIERLFDSLMRDYPISTFLFWKVDKNKIKDFQFYEFLKNYHEKDNKHNQKADLVGDEDVISILDGQQRMTSLYLALNGSYAKKIPYYRWDSPHAFPKKKLYLNILKKSDDIELEYDFRFLSDNEAKNDENNFWFPVSKVMDFTDSPQVMNYVIENELMNTSKYTSEQSYFATSSLSKLQNAIHQKGNISFFLEEGEELDKVLQIFIRINSGGTKLSYSDLLLSIATAQWKEKDAREVIHEFVDEINAIGEGFAFNKDFVLKSCLVLADFNDIKFKVDNFTKENMVAIEKNWDNISESVKKAIELLAKYGYNRDNLISLNAVIPIAYFIQKNNFNDSILHSSARENDRRAIKEWLARVLLKGTFGGTPDAIYPVMRNLVNENLGRFPIKEVIDYYRGKRKSISFTNDDIENILNYDYGSARTYCALTLLYPALNYSFKYHQDHIHPKSFFSKRNLQNRGIVDPDLFILKYNKLPNLQLLQTNLNLEKNSKEFKDWLSSVYPNSTDQSTYLLQNHIDTEVSLDFVDFHDFFEKRKTKLKSLLKGVLNVTNEEVEAISEE